MHTLKKIQFHFPVTLIFQRIHSMSMLAVIAGIVLMAAFALNRPINTQQYQIVEQFAQQQRLADTQRMAQTLLGQDEVKNIAFYRLLHAYHYEQSHIKAYPAVEIQPERELTETSF